MSQMTDDMARNIVRHWEEKKTHYGITAWEECQLARRWLKSAAELDRLEERERALVECLRGLLYENGTERVAAWDKARALLEGK